MPLFDLFKMAKNKHDVAQDKTSTDLSYIPENDFFELVWENGQIAVQGQSSRNKRTQNSYNLPCYSSLPSHCPRNKDKELGNGNTCSTSGKLVSFNDNPCGLDEFPDAMPSEEMCLDQDDDIVPWFSYPINDFMHELSGVTDNHEPTNPNNFDAKGGCNHVYKERQTRVVSCGTDLEERYQLKGSGLGSGSSSSPAVCEITKPKNNTSQQPGLVSGRPEMELTSYRSRLLEKDDIGASNAANQVVAKDSTLSQTGHPGPTSSANFQFVNFSHFSRPPSISRTYAETGGGAGSGFSNVNRPSGKEQVSSADCRNNADTDCAELNVNLRREVSSQRQNTTKQPRICSRDMKGKQIEEERSLKHSVATIHRNSSEKDKKSDQNSNLSTTRKLCDDEKSTEPVVVASSVCSGNDVERASENPTNSKRKSRSTEESDSQSEDVEEESVGVKKAPPARGSGSKRGRAAEVHNLSERRRRDRINEKMRALQELIPNCNKADKATMLDEAIEYLKMLQLQVQMMSMGAGFYMPHMLLPAQMQQTHMALMAQFAPLGYGMGMVDMNGGSSTYPMMQVPSMHGPHFPRSPVLPGASASVFGLPSHGLHAPMACAPFVPFPSGGSILQPANGVPATAAPAAAAANEGLQQSVPIPNNCQALDNSGNAILPQ